MPIKIVIWCVTHREPIADVDTRIQNLIRFHYPTVWDVFKREVRKRLVALTSSSGTGATEWQERPAWKAVKKIPSTAEHIIRSQRRVSLECAERDGT